MSDSDSSFYEESSFVKIFEGVGSIGAIYVSSTYEARDIQLLKQKNIQSVLTAQKQEKISLPSSYIKSYLYLQIEDDINFNIAQYFQQSFKFIEENRRLTNMLIHCSSGLNCSVAIVIAYLVKKYQYTYQEALTLVKRRYPYFNVNNFNTGFVHHLQYFAVQRGDFKYVQENHMRKRIQRVRRTVDGIMRTYTNQLTTQQKLLGCHSPMKYLNNESKSLLSLKSIGSTVLLPYQSIKKINQNNNPQQAITMPSYQLSQEYSKYLPKKTDEQIQDDQHHMKIVSQILLLTQQSKILQSKKIDSINSDVSAMKNYDRMSKSKKKHLTFYSPLQKYEKYEMFTQNKLNLEFQAILSTDI